MNDESLYIDAEPEFPRLTLAEFAASNRRVPNLAEAVEGGYHEGPGVVFAEGLHIEIQDNGSYCLCIGNVEQQAWDIEELIPALYEFGCSEGYLCA
jgi:hypothetical protein